MSSKFDVIVVGGGHAGIEAAWAASARGARTALVTMQREAIGRMSCNPAIGGLGKGHMVREIDALGGLMGLATDRAGIQFRMLNRSKGPAVWAPRAQCDRDLYPQAAASLLEGATNLTIIEGSVEHIETREIVSRPSRRDLTVGQQPESRVRVTAIVMADRRRFLTDTVILTTGTFLRGLMHCGDVQTPGGRVHESSATGLSAWLTAQGFELRRLKTGTPPRVDRDSVDTDACTEQPGDEVPTPFSAMTDAITQPQIICWITWTNPAVHELIRDNLSRAPMYSGQIESTGPRYCPSIEDKVVRFADKQRHQVFLEPEGYDHERIYCNGISTSLPEDVQQAMIRHIPGLQSAKILQPGYAVEYDCVPTHQITSGLETKRVGGLFLAGQINGTSGYEEAAGQGLLAGINAVGSLCGDSPFVLGRDQAYLGVMIDDLITRPPTEPYRMFTSRAEYRLLLRADNADQRLTPLGRKLGLVDDDRWSRFQRKQTAAADILALVANGAVAGVPLTRWMRRHDATLESFAEGLGAGSGRVFCTDDLRQVLVDAQYAGYVDRQARQIERFRRLESMTIPDDLDYAALPGLRAEARQQLTRVNPRTLGQAARISGINPPDVSVIWIHLARQRKRRAG